MRLACFKTNILLKPPNNVIISGRCFSNILMHNLLLISDTIWTQIVYVHKFFLSPSYYYIYADF